MGELFLKVLSISLSASLLAVAVLVLRPVLKLIRSPRWVICAVWGLVALRLLVPVSIPSELSAVPQSVASGSVVTRYAQSHWEAQREAPPTVSSSAPMAQGEGAAATLRPQQGERPISKTLVLAALWLAGAGLMLLYALWSYWRIRKEVAVCVEEDGLWMCDHLQSPFILGVFRPRIYLPSDLSGPLKQAVVAHERAHLSRRDHLWKPLGFLLLAVHWFNPVMWVCYLLLSRDIESACDERVVRTFNLQEKKLYSNALLSLSLPRRQLAVCPLAFGEVGVKERIKEVLHYKKPAFWVTAAAVAACAVLALCFLTSQPAKHSGQITPLKEAAQQYDRAQAMEEGVLWVDHGENTVDLQPLQNFLELSGQRRDAFLRVVDVYPPEKRSKETWDAGVLGNQGSMYVTDVTYHDGVYTTQSYDNGPDGALSIKTYPYLVVDSFQERGNYGVAYLLSHDAEMTWERYMGARLSSTHPNADQEAMLSHTLYWKIGQPAAQPLTEHLKQIPIIADGVAQWAVDDGISEPWDFTVADLNGDGQLEVMTTRTQGSGHFTETHIWSVNGETQKLEAWDEGASSFVLERQGGEPAGAQSETLPAYQSQQDGGLYLVTRSHVQDGGSHLYETKAITRFGPQNRVQLLERRHKEVIEQYEGQTVQTLFTDEDGRSITQAEYENFPSARFADYLPKEVQLVWQSGLDTGALDKEALVQALTECWNGFQVLDAGGFEICLDEQYSHLDYVPGFEEQGAVKIYAKAGGRFVGSGTDSERIWWSSDNEKVCRVDEYGYLYLCGAGEATVTASYRGMEATLPVKIEKGTVEKLQGMEKIFMTTDGVLLGNSREAFMWSYLFSDGRAVCLMPEECPEPVKWSLDGTSGQLLGKDWDIQILADQPGRHVLTVESCGASCEIEIVVVRPEDTVLRSGGEMTLTAGNLPSETCVLLEVDGEKIDVTWDAEYQSMNEHIVRLEDRLWNLYGVALGRTVVTASLLGRTVEIPVTVVA